MNRPHDLGAARKLVCNNHKTRRTVMEQFFGRGAPSVPVTFRPTSAARIVARAVAVGCMWVASISLKWLRAGFRTLQKFKLNGPNPNPNPRETSQTVSWSVTCSSPNDTMTSPRSGPIDNHCAVARRTQRFPGSAPYSVPSSSFYALLVPGDQPAHCRLTLTPRVRLPRENTIFSLRSGHRYNYKQHRPHGSISLG